MIRVGGFPPLKGRDAVLAWLQPDAIVNPHAEIHEYIVNDDRVLVRLTTSGTGAGSGVEMSLPVWQVWTFEDGQVVRTGSFLEEAEAREAAGLAG